MLGGSSPIPQGRKLIFHCQSQHRIVLQPKIELARLWEQLLETVQCKVEDVRLRQGLVGDSAKESGKEAGYP